MNSRKKNPIPDFELRYHSVKDVHEKNGNKLLVFYQRDKATNLPTGATSVLIIGDNWLSAGFAYHNPKDVFCKKYGREIALNRALEAGVWTSDNTLPRFSETIDGRTTSIYIPLEAEIKTILSSFRHFWPNQIIAIAKAMCQKVNRVVIN